MARRPRVARVILESPLPQLDHLFDYGIPEPLVDAILVGTRVKVPLGNASRLVSGYVVETVDIAEYEGTLSEIDSSVSSAPVLAPDVYALARTIADRGAGSAADVLRLAVPPRQVRVEKAWLATMADERRAAELRAPPPIAAPPAFDGYRAGTLEAAVAERSRLALTAAAHPVALPVPPDDRADEPDRPPHPLWAPSWALTLATAAAHCLASGHSAIIAVPDYRDLDSLESALHSIGADAAVARVDAAKSNADRYRSFLDCLSGPRIVIGNRSALYAPADSLGLIAVWDDGDPLHVEQLAPYAHTRDVALVRQQQSGCALWFASHGRSVEVQRLVQLGWLAEAAPEPLRTPRVILTAQQNSTDVPAGSARIPSSTWRQAAEALASGPVLVQVARPGYAPIVACANCRQAARCSHCDGPLGLADAAATPACGWCGRIAADWVCPACGETRVRTVSRGSGRTAEELGRAFPGSRVILADGEHPLQHVSSSPALIVATPGAEPLAEGGYRAVLLLDGERMLGRESMRVAEDCLRRWSNAAALAAQSAPVMLVGVAGPVAEAMATWRHEAYAAGELADRRTLTLPPAVRIASVSGDAAAVQAALASVDDAAVIDVLGPVPISDGWVRAILRFEYRAAGHVASALRAAIVRNATKRRASPAGRGWRNAPKLKVKFDDPEVL